ncbi:MAG: TetR/AcrR family transcriptional regulator [Pseudomonadota bacterium]
MTEVVIREIEGSSQQAQPSRLTREDWLKAARDVLLSKGVEQVKIMTLARAIGGSRSSFYWFFKDRQDLLDELFQHWLSTNTNAIVEQAQRPSASISQAVLQVFECWVDDAVFDARLDFAVREWARRAPEIRAALDKADQERVEALEAMFTSHGFEETEAFVRARTLYFMQIGYYALEVDETIDERLKLVPTYVFNFSGEWPAESDLSRFAKIAMKS